MDRYIRTIAFLRHITVYGQNYYCGYVGVNKEDHEKIISEFNDTLIEKEGFIRCLDDIINVHGGITFSSTFADKGFTIDTEIIPISDIPADWRVNYHCYGFDFNHAGDDLIENKFDVAYKECFNFRNQIETLIGGTPNDVNNNHVL